MRCTLPSVLLTATLLANGCADHPSQSESVAAPQPVSTNRDASTSRSQTSSAPGIQPVRAQTPEERQVALDKRLNDSLGSFDAQLRTEQQRIAQERDAHRASVAAVATDSGSNTDKSAGPAGRAATGMSAPGPTSTNKRGDIRAERSGDLKSERTAGGANGAAGGNGATAAEIPDGSDDDIVARRLRRAAEQETDPELKEKLWKEYVEYRTNARGK